MTRPIISVFLTVKCHISSISTISISRISVGIFPRTYSWILFPNCWIQLSTVTLLSPNMRPVPRNHCPANRTGVLIAFYLIYSHACMIGSHYTHILCTCTVVSGLLFRFLLCYQTHILDCAWQAPFVFTAYHIYLFSNLLYQSKKVGTERLNWWLTGSKVSPFFSWIRKTMVRKSRQYIVASINPLVGV